MKGILALFSLIISIAVSGQNWNGSSVPTTTGDYNTSIQVGEMNNKLLEKIEELTLYLIELKKENEVMRREIETLNK